MVRSRLLAGLALAGASALLAAAPGAHAVGESTVSGAFSSPTADTPISHGEPLQFSVTWSPQDASPAGPYIDQINIVVSRPGAATPQEYPCTLPPPANGQPRSCSAPAVNADYNGIYTAQSNAHSCTVVGNCGWTPVSSPKFVVNNPPVVPKGLSARPFDDATRTVKIQWTANPEPDLVDYVVGRQIDNGSVQLVGTVNAMSNPYYKDTDTPNGGSYAYSVIARRASPTDSSGKVQSDPTTPVVVNVPAPPPPPTTTVAGGGTPGSSVPGGGTGGTGGGSTGTKPVNGSGGPKPGANYSPNKLDINAFTAALNAAKAKHGGLNNSGGISEAPAAPDPGYSGSLPYKTPANTPEDGASAANAPPLAKAATAKNNVRTAAAVAGGLLAIVLAMHGMWLRAEVKRAALLEPVEPEPFGPHPLLELG